MKALVLKGCKGYRVVCTTRCPSENSRGCAIAGVHNVASSKIYKQSNVHDQTMYTRWVYIRKISPGKQTIGMLWAQPWIMSWKISHVILEQMRIIWNPLG